MVKPYRTSFRIRVYEAGPGGVAGPETLANYLQESAASHADLLGVGAEPMAAEGLAWILTRLRLLLVRSPRLGELLSVETWPAKLDRRLALRAWQLTDSEGSSVATAIAHWSVFDFERRRLTSFPGWFLEKIEASRPAPIDFTQRSLPSPTQVTAETRLLPRRSELDVNGHVNNAHLLGWLLEPLPEMPDRRLIEIDCAFRSECQSGDAVLSKVGSETDGARCHALVREADGTDLVRAVSRWA